MYIEGGSIMGRLRKHVRFSFTINVPGMGVLEIDPGGERFFYRGKFADLKYAQFRHKRDKGTVYLWREGNIVVLECEKCGKQVTFPETISRLKDLQKYFQP